jgi:hypothetical protein
MVLRHKVLGSFLRTFAVVALVAFVVAQVVCFQHCNTGTGRAGKRQTSCHASCHSSSHQLKSNASAPGKTDPMPMATCLTFKQGMLNPDSVSTPHCDLSLLYVVGSDLLALDADATDVTVIHAHGDWPPKWVFTPELCLGPAHANLAPPLLS